MKCLKIIKINTRFKYPPNTCLWYMDIIYKFTDIFETH